MVNNIAFLIERGHVQKPVYIQFVMGILGGITASSENLLFLVDYAQSRSAILNFRFAWRAGTSFLFVRNRCSSGAMSGSELEDNLYLDRGILAESNAEQVAKIDRIAGELALTRPHLMKPEISWA